MLSAADGKDSASIMAVAENISAIQRSIESQLAARTLLWSCSRPIRAST